jgi:hypothetical protein
MRRILLNCFSLSFTRAHAGFLAEKKRKTHPPTPGCLKGK